MIRLALTFVMYMLPGIILGYIILWIFPNIPHFLLYVINIGVILGYFIRLRRKEKAELAFAKAGDNTEATFSKTMGFFLLIATAAATGGIYSVNKAAFYIDNASDKDVTVTVAHCGTFTIKANEYKEIAVAMGETEVEYNGKKRVFDITERGKWVWNIDSMNMYIRTNIEYSNSVDLFKNPNKTDEKMPNMDVIKKEFFFADVDYMFDAPEKITVDKSVFDNKAVSKKVLYRMNGEGFMDEEEESDEAPDSIQIEKNTIQEDKPSKNI